jgi:hypothetical protein
LVAHTNSVLACQDDDAASLGRQQSDHSELFGEVCPGELHVAVDNEIPTDVQVDVDDEIPSDVHVSPEEAGQAITCVDGPQCCRPTLRFGIDTH